VYIYGSYRKIKTGITTLHVLRAHVLYSANSHLVLRCLFHWIFLFFLFNHRAQLSRIIKLVRIKRLSDGIQNSSLYMDRTWIPEVRPSMIANRYRETSCKAA